MFVKGSRYRSLPQSQKVNARGQHVLSVDLRFIPTSTGQFQHAVGERDRLDLLAFKYYTDAERWWLIADANPEHAFPVDLLDMRPFVVEEFSLLRPSTLERRLSLRQSLEALASVGPAGLPADERYEPATVFFTTAILVRYTSAAARPRLVDEIHGAGFRLLASVAWTGGGETAEQFTFEDGRAKQEWDALIETLSMLTGVRAAESLAAGERVRIEYNTAKLRRSALLAQIERHGFQIDPSGMRLHERLGARIVIPPDEAV